MAPNHIGADSWHFDRQMTAVVNCWFNGALSQRLMSDTQVILLQVEGLPVGECMKYPQLWSQSFGHLSATSLKDAPAISDVEESF
jgi:hypothetical protein